MAEKYEMIFTEDVYKFGPENLLKLADRWVNENQHMGIDLQDLGTSIGSWEDVRKITKWVIRNPFTHPMRHDPAIEDFQLYVRGVDENDG